MPTDPEKPQVQATNEKSETPEAPKPASAYDSNPLMLIRPAARGVLLNWPIYLLLLVVVAAAFLVGVGLVVGAILGNSSSLVPLLIICFVGFVLIALYTAPAFTRLMLGMADNRKLTVREVFNYSASLPWKLFGTQLLVGLAVLGGFILLIVPGIIFAVWFSQTHYVVVSEGIAGTAALRRSRQLVRNRFIDILGTVSISPALNVLLIVPILGGLAAAIGSLLVAPVFALRYRQLAALKATGDGSDIPTHAANWGLILLAIIGLGIGGQRDFNQSHLRPPVENRTQVY